jgi:hypothetical protein
MAFIGNSIIPRVFTEYTAEESIFKSRLFQSGVVEPNSGISALISGGGNTYDLPHWQDVGGTSGDVPTEGATNVVRMQAARQVFRKQSRERAWETNDLVKVYAGDNPLEKLQNMVIAYWAQAFDIVAINTLRGLFALNAAKPGGQPGAANDLILDISAGVGAAGVLSSDAVINAQALLGENGTVGRGDLNGGDFVAIAVHPQTYALMRRQNAIDFVQIGDQTRPTAFYMGMQVIVDRNLPIPAGGTYDTYIAKQGALQFGQTTAGYEPTETDRNPLAAFGLDSLVTRRVFAMHPVGMSWLENPGVLPAGLSPTDAELRNAAAWAQSYQTENIRAVLLRHRIA